MRITGRRMRVGLMVLAATLAIALGVFGGVGNTAHATPSGYSGCTEADNLEGSQTNSPINLTNSKGTIFAYEVVHIDGAVDSHGNICAVRARADVFPYNLSGNYFGETMYTELCLVPNNYGTANECYGGIGVYLQGSATSYTCPNVTYPNHCAIVGPWVPASMSGTCASHLDAEAMPGTQYADHNATTSWWCY